ncbi:MAG: hypothetical protein JSR83_18695 [Proteobacteria bacterium]|nr:hypothetical protein [Pseudomonadota bacterium]
MTTARDIFAETNPAFCCIVLSQFCSAYQQMHPANQHPTAALIYLIVPIAISEDLAPTFEGCNISTGLAVWLNRNPKVLDELAKKVNLTLEISTAAIRFGCFSGTLRFTSDGAVESSLKRIPASVIGGVAGSALKRARLFGAWTATMGSPRSVLEALGVSV